MSLYPRPFNPEHKPAEPFEVIDKLRDAVAGSTQIITPGGFFVQDGAHVFAHELPADPPDRCIFIHELIMIGGNPTNASNLRKVVVHVKPYIDADFPNPRTWIAAMSTRLSSVVLTHGNLVLDRSALYLPVQRSGEPTSAMYDDDRDAYFNITAFTVVLQGRYEP